MFLATFKHQLAGDRGRRCPVGFQRSRVKQLAMDQRNAEHRDTYGYAPQIASQMRTWNECMTESEHIGTMRRVDIATISLARTPQHHAQTSDPLRVVHGPEQL